MRVNTYTPYDCVAIDYGWLHAGTYISSCMRWCLTSRSRGNWLVAVESQILCSVHVFVFVHVCVCVCVCVCVFASVCVYA